MEGGEKPRRPTTVIFNVEYNRAPTAANSRSTQSAAATTAKLRPQSRKSVLSQIKTADLSHTTDTKGSPQVPTFIPKEFTRELTTPIPLRPGTSMLDPENKQWKTTVFPSPEATDSRQEVENLGEWLNTVLAQNQKETKDPLELATNARHWFSIAYEELCRQVSVECPERSTLLLSIWKRYQALFARVVQLHQEEKTYLVTCHKERTSALKSELDTCQARLKHITQQYRDDQERWSNAREREETKFANMRKKLDLQVKNKRILMMQIKGLQDRLEKEKQSAPTTQPSTPQKEQPEKSEIETTEEETTKQEQTEKENINQNEEQSKQEGTEPSTPVKKEEPKSKEEPDVVLTPQSISDRAHQIRHKIRTEFPQMLDTAACLDDILRFLDKDHDENYVKTTKEYFPTILKDIPVGFGHSLRPLSWVLATITYAYSQRLNELCNRRTNLDWAPNRQHFANTIFEQLLVVFGSPQEAAETFFMLVESARHYSERGVKRCTDFLRFLDVEQPYRDCVFLDFYCFCLGTFLVSTPGQPGLFADVFEETGHSLQTVPSASAADLCRKVLYSVSEPSSADGFIGNLRETLRLDEREEIPVDDLLEVLMNAFQAEEIRMTEQLREQYEMDAAQYGGIATLGQFQTLAMFSSKKLDQRAYTEMMRETMMQTTGRTVAFQDLADAMHRRSMLVPVSFERLDYSSDNYLEDTFGFMREEYRLHVPEIETKLEKARKSDDGLYKQLNAAKAKFEQVVETKRTGFFTEVAQRELYEKLRETVFE